MNQKSRDRLNQLQPQVRPLFLGWLENCEQVRGIEMRVIETHRTEDRQNELYEIGRKADIIRTPDGGITASWKKVGPTVTNAKGRQSYHFWRVAVDAAPKDYLDDPGWNPDGEYWEIMRREARKIGLETPMSWDKPHVQYTEGHHWREWGEEFPAGKLPDDYFRGLTTVRVNA